jgi:hypothetical protein
MQDLHLLKKGVQKLNKKRENIMDNTISKLLDFFKHIVRDLLTYILSGLIVIANFAYILLHLNKTEFNILFDNNYVI